MNSPETNRKNFHEFFDKNDRRKIVAFSMLGGGFPLFILGYMFGLMGGNMFAFYFFLFGLLGLIVGAISGLLNVKISKSKISLKMAFFLAFVESTLAFFCIWTLLWAFLGGSD